MLIHQHREFPSDMFTIMCAVGATVLIGKVYSIVLDCILRLVVK